MSDCTGQARSATTQASRSNSTPLTARRRFRGWALRGSGAVEGVVGMASVGQIEGRGLVQMFGDRKSTRLNSSHANISYAVFCLKKKKDQYRRWNGTTADHGLC